jgi:glycosyltransferase involved in cell wall biosynthesis
MLSILTPAFNESANLEALYHRIVDTMERLALEWEWLVVDDHSRDDTFAVVERLARADARVRGLRLARNSGSHVAITCGLHHLRGEAAVMMAADLQDPPETIGAMLDRWRQGARVVWATRRQQPGDRSHAGFAAFYYWVMRRVVGMTDMPARGADFFLIDRVAIDAFCRHDERNVSVLALITWLGFEQAVVDYDKQPRAAGQSGWTVSRKIRLVVDSVTAFSDAPIRAVELTGVALLLVGGVAGASGLVGGHRLVAVGGLMTILCGLQLVALGVVGEYVWRAMAEAKRRPQYLIERLAGVHGPASLDPREALSAGTRPGP